MIPKDKFGMTTLVLLTSPYERDNRSSVLLKGAIGLDQTFDRLVDMDEKRPGAISPASEYLADHRAVLAGANLQPGVFVSISTMVDVIEMGFRGPALQRRLQSE